MKTTYETTVVCQGGRDGVVRSQDGLLDIKLSLPKSMGGEESHTNPEQLFAAAYAACFENAILHIAKMRQLPAQDSKVIASVRLITGTSGMVDLGIRLSVSLPRLDQQLAKQLMLDAQKICPYSRATKGNIDVQIELAD